MRIFRISAKLRKCLPKEKIWKPKNTGIKALGYSKKKVTQSLEGYSVTM